MAVTSALGLQGASGNDTSELFVKEKKGAKGKGEDVAWVWERRKLKFL